VEGKYTGFFMQLKVIENAVAEIKKYYGSTPEIDKKLSRIKKALRELEKYPRDSEFAGGDLVVEAFKEINSLRRAFVDFHKHNPAMIKYRTVVS